MKKLIGCIIGLAIIGALVAGYILMGHKAATESKTYLENSKATIDNAVESMEGIEKAREESQRAIEQMGGGTGR